MRITQIANNIFFKKPQMIFLNCTGSGCREGEHKCGGQDLCLPQEALCNGIGDCKDGSDEKNCEVCIQGAKVRK